MQSLPSSLTTTNRRRYATGVRPSAVEIEAIGNQGDGIARVERGYVIIVPETEEGDHVTIEVTEVNPNVAFGDVVERDVDLDAVSN